ncbi:hypothetical protein EC973_006046 [Apophysomyces ossiformis]|uniref:Probable lysosomal cobalamin transporter n=1 Tax=Apophysomyces ossiformis TaxID=679940 RepID=A0A8H7BZ15_9FUNG|nr:hypothetical protein EC973_006046 [Apophysomyces ossiformis]
MPAVVGIAWTIYAIVSATLFVFSTLFVRHYQNKHESERFATITAIVTLALVFATLALLPIDIFLVSSTVNQHTGLKQHWATPAIIANITDTVQLVYYGCYGSVAFFSFLLVPFAYFYFEEYEEEQTVRDRALSAMKYTSFFVVICILLFLFGLFLKPSHTKPRLDLDWFKKLLTESNGEKAASFVIASLFLLGLLVFTAYTAPGLSILPLNMIKGRRGLDAENEDAENRLMAVRERRRAMQAKHVGANKALSSKDQREIENLEDEESVDKISHSVCGSECGYIIDHPELFNPINYIFVNLSKMFPLDYIFMVILIIYFFLATMSGVISIGVRFLWITLYRIRKGATAPQGLLFATVLLTLSLLALNYTITTVVAPEYAHFGSQVYCNQTIGGIRDCSDRADLIVPCDITGPTDICTPTVSSTLIDRIIVNTPFFGMLFYYSQWAFLGVFILGFVIAILRRPRNNVDAESDDLMDAEEEQGLLNARQRRYGSQQSSSAVYE